MNNTVFGKKHEKYVNTQRFQACNNRSKDSLELEKTYRITKSFSETLLAIEVKNINIYE